MKFTHITHAVLLSLLALMFVVMPASAATPAALPDTPVIETVAVDFEIVPPMAHPNYVLAIPVAPEVEPVKMELVPVQPEQLEMIQSNQVSITAELITSAQVETLVNSVFNYASAILTGLLTIVAVGAGIRLAFRLADKIQNMF